MLFSIKIILIRNNYCFPHRENSEELTANKAEVSGEEQPTAAEEPGEGGDDGSKDSADKQEEDET